MTTSVDIDIQQALLEGARDRLRSLGASHHSEALLVIHSLRESSTAASLTEFLPVLDAIGNELARGDDEAVDHALKAVQNQLRLLELGERLEDDEFRECFREEANSSFEEIGRLLAHLELDLHDRESLEALCRVLHTLKGSAAMIGRHEVASSAHLIEELLEGMCQGLGSLGLTHLRRLGQAIELLEHLVEAPEKVKEIEVTLLTLIGGSEDDASRQTLSRVGALESRRRSAGGRSETASTMRISLSDLRRFESRVSKTQSDLIAVSGHILRLEEIGQDLRRGIRPLLRADALDIYQKLSAVERRLRFELEDLGRQLVGTKRGFQTIVDDLGELQRVRAAWIFDRVVNAADELVQRGEQQLSFIRSGDEITIERDQAAWLLDALIHLVRNAVAHGLESAVQRIALGKQPSGRITLGAEMTGESIILRVDDDGRGVDLDSIRRAARSRGLVSSDEIEAADDEHVLEWIFLSGLSTRSLVDETAGRGVGLDAVKSEVVKHGGQVRVETWPGQGTRFELEVPRRSASVEILLFDISGHQIGILRSEVESISSDQESNQREVPTLAALLGLAEPDAEEGSCLRLKGAKSLKTSVAPKSVNARLDAMRGRLARLGPFRGLALYGETPEVAFVVDVNELMRGEGGFKGGTDRYRRGGARSTSERRRGGTLLLADDSESSRRSMERVLRSAGFEVICADDGAAALALLESSERELSMLVTDYRMPIVDGLELAQKVRTSPSSADLPIVVVTSEVSDELREKARALDIDALVAKAEGSEGLLSGVERVFARREPFSGKR